MDIYTYNVPFSLTPTSAWSPTIVWLDFYPSNRTYLNLPDDISVPRNKSFLQPLCPVVLRHSILKVDYNCRNFTSFSRYPVPYTVGTFPEILRRVLKGPPLYRNSYGTNFGSLWVKPEDCRSWESVMLRQQNRLNKPRWTMSLLSIDCVSRYFVSRLKNLSRLLQ